MYEGLLSLLGRTNESIAEFVDPFTAKYGLLTDARRGTVLFSDQDTGNQTFTTEELVGTILRSAMEIAQANSHESAPIKDCVVTVPDFWGQHQRDDLVDAARLADVAVTGVINENTAVHLQYGLDRRAQWTADKNFTLVVFNMGSAHTIVTAAVYSAVLDKKNASNPQVEVIAKAWDATLGGRSFDVALASHLEGVFLAKNKGKVSSLGDKARAKLIKEANRVKEVLVANVETYASVEALQDEIDFSAHVTRADFDKICAELIARASKPLLEVLAAVGNKVDAVELFGGGGRITKLGEEFAKLLPEGVVFGKHLNGDETAAMGAGFFAAMKSSQFRARFKMVDRLSYGISAHWGGSEASKARESTLLFPAGSKPTKKVVTVSESTDFEVTMRYENPDRLPRGTSGEIVHFNITGVERTLEGRNLTTKPKVTVSFRLTESETVTLPSAELVFDEEKVVLEEVPHNETEAYRKEQEEKEKEKSGKAEDPEQPAASGETAEEGATTDNNNNNSTSSNNNSTSSSTKGKKKAAKKHAPEYRNVTKVFSRSIELPVRVTRLGIPELNSEERSAARERLRAMQNKEDAQRALDSARNSLESSIYSIRTALESPSVGDVTTEDQRSTLSKAAEEAESWLYGESDGAKVADFDQRRASLTKPFEAVQLRIKEIVARPKAFDYAKQFLNESLHQVATWPTTRPHLKEDDVKSLLKRLEDLKDWVAEKRDAQAALPLYETPAVLSSEIEKKINLAADRYRELARRSAPKPKKQQEPPKSKPEDKPKDDDDNKSKDEDGKTTDDGGKNKEDAKSKEEDNNNKEEPEDPKPDL